MNINIQWLIYYRELENSVAECQQVKQTLGELHDAIAIKELELTEFRSNSERFGTFFESFVR